MWGWALMVQINDASFCKEAVTGVKKSFFLIKEGGQRGLKRMLGCGFSAWVLDIGSKSSSLLWINIYTPEGAILPSKIVVGSCDRRGDTNAALSFLRPDSLKGS